MPGKYSVNSGAPSAVISSRTVASEVAVALSGIIVNAEIPLRNYTLLDVRNLLLAGSHLNPPFVLESR